VSRYKCEPWDRAAIDSMASRLSSFLSRSAVTGVGEEDAAMNQEAEVLQGLPGHTLPQGTGKRPRQRDLTDFDVDDFSESQRDGHMQVGDERHDAAIYKAPRVPVQAVAMSKADSVEYNDVGYQRALFESSLSLPSHRLRLPWETGILRPQSMPAKALQAILVRPELPDIETYLASTSKQLELAKTKTRRHITFPSAVKRIKDLTMSESRDATRRRACQLWLQAISIDPSASATGRLMCSMVASLRTDAEMIELLDRIMIKKAPGTMLKRAQSFYKFILFCKSRDLIAVPLQEESANLYCEFLANKKGTGATAISSFLQSVNFMGFTLQFDHFKLIASSPRIKGLSDKMLLSKRYLQQSEVYTVDDVCWMTSFVCDDSGDKLEQLFVAHNLFCLFARSRWGDHQNIEELVFDTNGDSIGYVTGKASHIKTSNTVAKRRQFVPITAPLWQFVEGFSLDWWTKWLRLRRYFGLKEGPGIPLLPAPSANGGFTSRPLSAGESSNWIRDLMAREQRSKGRKTSHAAKSTPLSWLAKWGVDEPTRKLLGYHVQSSQSSMLHYSRDAISGALQMFNRVISDIVDGTFRPDSQRSEYFVRGHEKFFSANREKRAKPVQNAQPERPEEASSPSQPEPLQSQPPNRFLEIVASWDAWEKEFDKAQAEREQAEGPDADANSDRLTRSTDSSDELTDIDDDGHSDADMITLLRRPEARGACRETLYIHKRSSVLHMGRKGCGVRLACGRLIGTSLIAVTEPDNAWFKCKDCFGRPVSD
jgi:hypothetical protein